ncbi:MAG: hypothetical protein K0R90_1450 [Oscillospiraceae bacterium]|jgi:hypothetical protein|nr:hypothetical protein [Oscillospiraceae bacterium]
MGKIQKFDDETQRYFNSLPAHIQESIMQTSPTITCKNDLVKIADHLTKTHGKGKWN